jgi:hypothetical protein
MWSLNKSIIFASIERITSTWRNFVMQVFFSEYDINI